MTLETHYPYLCEDNVKNWASLTLGERLGTVFSTMPEIVRNSTISPFRVLGIDDDEITGSHGWTAQQRQSLLGQRENALRWILSEGKQADFRDDKSDYNRALQIVKEAYEELRQWHTQEDGWPQLRDHYIEKLKKEAAYNAQIPQDMARWAAAYQSTGIMSPTTANHPYLYNLYSLIGNPYLINLLKDRNIDLAARVDESAAPPAACTQEEWALSRCQPSTLKWYIGELLTRLDDVLSRAPSPGHLTDAYWTLKYLEDLFGDPQAKHFYDKYTGFAERDFSDLASISPPTMRRKTLAAFFYETFKSDLFWGMRDALCEGNETLFKHLLEIHGSSTGKSDNAMGTLLLMAYMQENPHLVELLMNYGARCPAAPCHAVADGKTDVLRLLLRYRWYEPLNAPGWFDTAADSAIKNKNMEAFCLLQEWKRNMLAAHGSPTSCS